MDADLAYPPEHITGLNPTQYDSILEIPIDQLGGDRGHGRVLSSAFRLVTCWKMLKPDGSRG